MIVSRNFKHWSHCPWTNRRVWQSWCNSHSRDHFYRIQVWHQGILVRHIISS